MCRAPTPIETGRLPSSLSDVNRAESFINSERVLPGTMNLKSSSQPAASFRSASRRPSTDTSVKTPSFPSNSVPVRAGKEVSWETAKIVSEIMLRKRALSIVKLCSGAIFGIEGYSSALMPTILNWALPPLISVISLSSTAIRSIPWGIRLMISLKSLALKIISPFSVPVTGTVLVIPSSVL